MAGFAVVRRGIGEQRDTRHTGSPFNVRDYGAYGNGTNDDTAALQATITACSNSGGGIVFVPHTSAAYNITRALITYPHVRIVGEQTRSSGASLIQAAAGTYSNGPTSSLYMLKYSGGDAYWHGGALENVAFDCNNIAGLGGCYFQQPGENSLIDRVRVDNAQGDAVYFTGGAATGLIRSLNGINNTGALLHLDQQANGSWVIESLSGDSNGNLLRVSNAATGADPMSVTVVNLKAENTTSGRMDPVILLDGCDMLALNVIGGSYITTTAQTDVIRIDTPVTARSGPSVSVVGVEGNNPFNTGYTNIIRDTSTGKVVPITPTDSGYTNGRRLYPNVQWQRDLLIGGGGMVQQPIAAPAYGATVTPVAADGQWQTITVTNTTAFTVAAPPHPPTANMTAELVLEMFNNSGGVMGAITWNAVFVFPTGAWANPATGKRRFARFTWNGANWICTSLATADY